MKSAEVVCLYFGAHWCPPCKYFTPVLSKFYEEANKDGKKVEIVFISHDESMESFEEFFAHMPWIAVPYNLARLEVAQKYKISGIPTLLVMNKDGTVKNKNGRGDVANSWKSPEEIISNWKWWREGRLMRIWFVKWGGGVLRVNFIL